LSIDKRKSPHKRLSQNLEVNLVLSFKKPELVENSARLTTVLLEEKRIREQNTYGQLLQLLAAFFFWILLAGSDF